MKADPKCSDWCPHKRQKKDTKRQTGKTVRDGRGRDGGPAATRQGAPGATRSGKRKPEPPYTPVESRALLAPSRQTSGPHNSERISTRGCGGFELTRAAPINGGRVSRRSPPPPHLPHPECLLRNPFLNAWETGVCLAYNVEGVYFSVPGRAWLCPSLGRGWQLPRDPVGVLWATEALPRPTAAQASMGARPRHAEGEPLTRWPFTSSHAPWECQGETQVKPQTALLPRPSG